MLDITSTPVAREITLELTFRERPVVEQSISVTHVEVSKFVGLIFPNQQVEHLGRTHMLAADKYGDVRAPSSLFFQAVHRAYADHHALGLRPEVLMYLINTVVAETVKRHPEHYRDLFTTSAEKLDIHVIHDGLVKGDPSSPWNEAIALFEDELRPHLPSRIMSQMLPELSTATSESSVASLVAFMDAASPYYDYHAHTRCGIPRIVLFGEAADYRKLVVAAGELAQHFKEHLSVYFANLLPVLETIAKTAETGAVDKNFWGQLYKHYRGSGSEVFSGWISSFLWYVHKLDWRTKEHSLVVKDEGLTDWLKVSEYEGVNSNSEPSHVSRVPFTWHYLGETLPMHFIGGILGLDAVQGALTPSLSYGVLKG